MWESYQVSTQLYGEVDAMTNRTITDAYYQSHIGMAEERLQKVGIRLAGVLNQIFEGSFLKGDIIPPPPGEVKADDPTSVPAGDPKVVALSEIGRHTGEIVWTCGQVYGDRAFSGLTLVNLGAAYPNHLLTVVLKGEAKEKWTPKDGKTICVKGKVTEYKGKPQIEISNPVDVQAQ